MLPSGTVVSITTDTVSSVENGADQQNDAVAKNITIKVVLENLLGSGAAGNVYLATDEHDALVAVKLVELKSFIASETTSSHHSFKDLLLENNLDKYRSECIKREIALLEFLQTTQNDDIIKVYNYGVAHSDQLKGIWLAFIMERAENSLRDRVLAVYNATKRYPQVDVCIEWLRPIALALDFLADKGYVHRDVKPHNILFVCDKPKLADFGLVKEISNATKDTTQHTYAGTPEYIAPEVDTEHFGPKCDQYSLAVTYFYIRSGQFPKKMINEVYPDIFSKNEIRCLKKALSKEPKDRYYKCLDFINDLDYIPQNQAEEDKRARRKRKLVMPWTKKNKTHNDWKPKSQRPSREAIPTYRPFWTFIAGCLVVMLTAIIISFLTRPLYKDISLFSDSTPPPVDEMSNLRAQISGQQITITDLQTQITALVLADPVSLRNSLNDNQKTVKTLRTQISALRAGLHYPTLFSTAMAAYNNSNYDEANLLLESCPISERKFEWNYLKHAVSESLLNNPNAPNPPITNPLLLSKLNKPVLAIAFSRVDNGARLAWGGEDEVVFVAQTEKPASAFVVARHAKDKGPVNAIAFHPQDELIASAGADGTVLVSPATKSLLPSRIIVSAGSPLTYVTYDKQGDRLAYAGSSNDIRFQPIENWYSSLIGFGGAVSERVVLRSLPPPATPAPPAQGAQPVAAPPYTTALTYSVAITSDFEKMYLKDHKGNLHYINLRTGQRIEMSTLVVGVAPASFSQLGSIAINDSEQLVAIAGSDAPMAKLATSLPKDRSVIIWDITKETERKLSLPPSVVTTCLSFAPTGRVVIGGTDGFIRIFHTGTGLELLSIPAHVNSEKKEVLSIAVSPDGKRIASGGADGQVLVWGAR